MTRSALPGLAIATAVLFVGLLLAFIVGRYPVSVADLLSVLMTKISGQTADVSGAVQSVVLQVRGPRVLAWLNLGTAPIHGPHRTTLKSKPERGPGGDPLRPVSVVPPRPRRGPRS